MKRIVFLCTAVLIFLLGCKKKYDQTKSFDKFPNVVHIKSETPYIEDTLLTITQLAIVDSLLICYDMYNKSDFMINIFNKNTFERLVGYGKKGGGPNEFQNPGYIAIDRERNIWLPNKLKNAIINIDSLLFNKRYTPEYTTFQSEKLNRTNPFKHFTKHGIVSSGAREPFDVLIFNKTTGQLEKKFGTPFLKKKNSYPDDGYFDIIKNHVYVNFSKNKIVSCYFYQDRISFYDISGNWQFDTYGPDHLEPKIDFVGPLYKFHYSAKRAYWLGGDSNDDFLFLTYLGKGAGERDPKTKKIIYSYPKKIHVYDWEGNPMTEINLDRTVAAIVIDEENERLIATDPNAYQPIFTIDISFLNKEI